MRHFVLFSTLVFLLLSGSKSYFNYSYSPHLAIVNDFNTDFVALTSLVDSKISSAEFSEGKDNYLDHSAKLDYQLRTVVIDPGHGGHDHGCSGLHSKEKNVSLKIAKKLGKYIKGKYPKVKVIYTREKDVFVPLHTRAKIANKNNADLFISIHCNAISKLKHLAKGTETYIMGLHNADENLDVAKRENEAILLEEDYEKNYGGFDPESPEGHIILAMVQNAFLEQSISFAEKVEANFEHIANRKSRGVKQAGFLVLRETTMPSVLIETGYLSNKTEEKFMRSSKGQDDLAFAIFQAFKAYKKEVELQNSTTPAPLPANRMDRIEFKKESSKSKNKKAIDLGKNNPMPSSTKTSNSPYQASTKKSKSVQKQFMVQLVSSSRKVKTTSKKWGKVKFPIEIKRENGNFKYLAGNFESLSAANAARKKLESIGFKGAFVVAYLEGKRVKVKS